MRSVSGMPPEPARHATRRAYILALAVLLADQASKAWLIGLMERLGGYFAVAPCFNLVMVWNRGIRFRLF